MSKDNLTPINGGGNKNPMHEIIDQMPQMIANMTLVAQLTRAKYDALIVEGFTPEQALELSKTIT